MTFDALYTLFYQPNFPMLGLLVEEGKGEEPDIVDSPCHGRLCLCLFVFLAFFFRFRLVSEFRYKHGRHVGEAF